MHHLLERLLDLRGPRGIAVLCIEAGFDEIDVVHVCGNDIGLFLRLGRLIFLRGGLFVGWRRPRGGLGLYETSIARTRFRINGLLTGRSRIRRRGVCTLQPIDALDQHLHPSVHQQRCEQIRHEQNEQESMTGHWKLATREYGTVIVVP
ncbi:MAG: hypothetical protein HZB57_02995 [Gammaproteobacteria bacterium]|nr:hypothetical protein [Gammaproteobacteria bacterium]